MELKEKIKLLSDLQNIVEDETLMATIKESPSGEVIEAVFKDAIQDKIKDLLGEMSHDDTVSQEIDSVRYKLGEIHQMFDTLGHSDFMKILHSINAKLSSQPQPHTAPQQAPQAQKQATAQPQAGSRRTQGSTLGYL